MLLHSEKIANDSSIVKVSLGLYFRWGEARLDSENSVKCRVGHS